MRLDCSRKPGLTGVLFRRHADEEDDDEDCRDDGDTHHDPRARTFGDAGVATKGTAIMDLRPTL